MWIFNAINQTFRNGRADPWRWALKNLSKVFFSIFKKKKKKKEEKKKKQQKKKNCTKLKFP